MGARPRVARGVGWGDIRLLAFDRPDKTRPVLVLTRSSIIAHLSTVTVAPITRTIRGVPTEVQISVEEGLRVPSVANFDAIQTVGANRLGRYIGSLPKRRKPEVRRALLFAFELEED